MLRPSQLIPLIMLATASAASAQSIIQGPVYSPVTGSRYTVIQGANWTQMRDFARAQGADLTTIESIAENTWINANLTANGSRKLFIGLSDAETEGTYRWSDGSTSTFRNWTNGNPGNNANEDHVLIAGATGTWDVRSANFTSFAVMERAGDIRVPEEFPSLAGALVFAAAAGGPVTVRVGPGVYSLPTQLQLGGQVTVKGAGANATTISCDWIGTTLRLTGTWTFEDLSIRGTTQAFGALESASSTTTNLRRCIVSSQLGRGSFPLIFVSSGTLIAETTIFRNAGAALYIPSPSSSSTAIFAVSCVFDNLNNVTDEFGNGTFRGVNCTFHNVGDTNGFFGSGIQAQIVNSLIANPTGPYQRSGVFYYYSMGTGIQQLDGNIDAAPQLVNPAAGNYSLVPNAPGTDAADFNTLMQVSNTYLLDAAGNPRLVDNPNVPDGPRAGTPAALDMGAYESQPCPADFNLDGTADFFDYLDFVQAFDAGCP
jgi:hypothetical protein